MERILHTRCARGFAALLPLALLLGLLWAPSAALANPAEEPVQLRAPLSPQPRPGHSLGLGVGALRDPSQGLAPSPAATDEPAQGGAEQPQGGAEQPQGRQRRKIHNGAYLIYFYQHDPADQETLLHILGLYWYRDKPNWQLHLTPLGAYWFWKDSPDWGLISPLAWHVRDGDTSYTGAWLWHDWDSRRSRFQTLFPLYWHHRDKIGEEELTLLGPAFWKTTPKYWTAGLAPLFWFGSGPEHSHWTALMLMGFEEAPDHRLFWSPLFFQHQDKVEDTSFGGLPLLLTFWKQEPDSQSVWQIPLFYQRKTQGSTLRMVTPLAWGYEEHDGDFSLSTLLPFFVGVHTQDVDFRLVLPALYLRIEDRDVGSQFTMLGPAYHWREGSTRALGLAPLLHLHEDPEAGRSQGWLLPIYYGRETPWRSTRVLLPLLYYRDQDRRRDSQTLVLGPFYKHHEKQDLDLGLVPLFFHHSRPQEQRELTLLTGLYYHHERPGYLTRQWGPLVQRREPERHTWGLLPLLQWEEDKQAQTQSLFVAPGLYWSQGPQRRRLMAGPLWSFRDGEQKFDGLLPLVMRYREADGSGFFLAPFFLDIEDRGGPGEAPWRFTWLLSGFRYSSRDGVSTSMVAPLYLESEDKRSGDWWALAAPWIYAGGNRRLQQRTIFAFPYYYEGSPSQADWWLFPLAYGHRDPEVAWWVSPLLFRWQQTQPGGSDLLLGPLLFGRYQAGDSDCVGIPGCLEGPGGADMGWLGPLVWSDTHKRRFRLLFPLMLDWADYEGQEEAFTVLPLYLSWQKTQDQVTRRLEAWTPLHLRYSEVDGQGRALTDLGTIGPAFAYDGERGSGFGLFPLLWHDRGVDEQGRASGHDILFPLLWRFFDEAQGSSTTVAGPLYAHSEPGRSSFGLAPLYFHGRSQHGQAGYDALAPLLWRSFGRDAGGEPWSTLLTPVGYHLSQGEDYSGLWLNTYYARQGEQRTQTFFPLLWHWSAPQEDELWVLPLYWHKQSPAQDQRLVLPVYYHSEDRVRQESTTWALPYLGFSSPQDDFDAVLPLYFQNRSRDGSLFRLALPLYLELEDGPSGDRFTALGPVWHASTGDGGSYDTGVFPLLWWGEDERGGDSYSVGFPLWWRFLWDEGTEQELSLTILGPAWHSRQSGGYDAGLFPLLWWGQDDEAQGDSYSVGFPFWWRFVGDQGQDRWTVLAPAWHHAHREGWSAGLFPVAGAWRDREEDSTRAWLLPFYYGRQREQWLATLGGLLWAWDDGPQEGGGAVVGPLYHAQDEHGSATGIFPVAHWQQDDQDNTRGWLFPVAYYDRDAQEGRRTVIAGPAFYHRDEPGDKTLWGAAPLLWGFSQGESSGSALLPAYYYEGRPQGHTLITPLGYSWRQGEEYSRWALLYGAGGDGRESWQTLFPLFWSRRSADGSGLDIALPLYARWSGSEHKSGGSVLFPFYWNFYNEPRGEDATVLFPLYWSFVNQKRDLTVVVPWFMSRRLDIKRTTHGLIPLYYYTEDPQGYTFNLLGGLMGIDHDKQRKETDYQLLWIPF